MLSIQNKRHIEGPDHKWVDLVLEVVEFEEVLCSRIKTSVLARIIWEKYLILIPELEK